MTIRISRKSLRDSFETFESELNKTTGRELGLFEGVEVTLYDKKTNENIAKGTRSIHNWIYDIVKKNRGIKNPVRRLKIRLVRCKDADRDHAASLRSYAHTYHKSDLMDGTRVICVANAFYGLPQKIRMGLVGHELGHLINPDASELEADRIGAAYLSRAWGMKVKIIRKDYARYGDGLETAVVC